MEFSTWINSSGIVLEILGFILILFAIKAMPFRGGSFTSGLDYLGNVRSTTHPRTNRIGILLVIFGLEFQLFSVLLILLNLVTGCWKELPILYDN